MKRLRKYLLNMESNDTTYNAVYRGIYAHTKEGIIFNKPGIKGAISDPTYWKDEISYTFEKSNKYSIDKPCIVISIPMQLLNIDSVKYKSLTADNILRQFNLYIEALNLEIENKARTAKENGKFYSHNPEPVVLDRNSCYVSIKNEDELYINIMILVQLPLKNHKKASRMLCKDLPTSVEKFISEFDNIGLNKSIHTYEKQMAIRAFLKSSDYCSFIANGSIVPRENGNNLPNLTSIAFKSCEEDVIEISGVIGMGIKKGVTLITGGGYSGKSTILSAISEGIYNHIVGDGRELIITDESAVQITAEDGRCVNNIDISMFVKRLPSGSPKEFSTVHASGSTSQAANIIEAVSINKKVLLIDEDKSASNFMMRDNVMSKLIKDDPLIPFTDHVRDLYLSQGVSTILVIGSSSEYLSIADNIIMMDNYRPQNITTLAKEIKKITTLNEVKPFTNCFKSKQRLIYSEGFTSYPKNENKEYLELSDLGFLLIGDERVDVRMIKSIISESQLNAIAFIIRKLGVRGSINELINLTEETEKLYIEIEDKGIDFLYTSTFRCDRWMEMPRKHEVLSVINRMRHVSFSS